MDLLDPLNVRLPESIARPFDFQCSSTTHLQHFPADELCSLETLSVLRRLGLRNALDRDGVLDAARSIADYRALETRNVGESDLMKRACVYFRTHESLCADLRQPASVDLPRCALLEFVTRHKADLLMISAPRASAAQPFKPESRGFGLFGIFRSSKKSETVAQPEPVDDASSQKVVDEFLAQLRSIEWLPVLTEAPEPGLPWYVCVGSRISGV
jgi:hypothetical protein